MNTVFIILGTYTISTSLYNTDKEVEYKSSCFICWKDSIKHCLFHKWNGVRLQRNWVEPPYETEWNFFVKSLLNGKTDALMHLLLLIIIITLI